MNKKSAILLFSVLFLLSLGVYYVIATVSTPTNIVKTGDGKDVANWAEGATPITVNLTANVASETNPLTNVTFQFATTGNLSWEFVDNLGVFLEDDNIADTNQNWTYINGIGNAGWNCTNVTTLEIVCANTTVSGLDGASNTSLMVTINVTGLLTTNEDQEVWNILAAYDNGGGSTNVAGTTETLGIDNQYPRLIEVNISDGNTTYHNSTWGTTYYLNGPLYIEALIEDSQLESKSVLYYTCNSTDPTIAPSDIQEVLTVTQQSVGTIDQRGYVASSRIDCAFNDIFGANETFRFVFLTNDTLNHLVILGNGTGNSETIPFNITLDDGELTPVIAKVNVTQTTITGQDGITTVSKTRNHGSELDGASDYLAANIVTFDIELTGGYKPASVMIVWNDTGAGTTSFGPAVVGGTEGYFASTTNLDNTAALNATNITAGAGDLGTGEAGDQAVGNGTTVLYTTILNLGGNISNDFVFYVYANNTENNYTRLSGPHRFTVDGLGPSMEMTAPTDMTITPRGSITYTCKASEGIGSGAVQIMWYLKKPGETSFTKKQDYANIDTDGKDSITFTGDDTNLAGDYDVKCVGVDNVGNEREYTSSSSETFSVHYSTGEGAVEGAGAAADIDLSTQEEVTITEKQGVISTFTLDGITVHTLKIKAVDEIAGTVTIVIESDPIEITLKIGETKEVDVDADGANDISVTLNKITDGAADITTKRLTPLPEKEAPTEEVPPTEKPAEEITPEVAPSRTWLWILIIVIIVVIGVGYWFMKRK